MINKLTRLIKGALSNNEKEIVIKTNEIIDWINNIGSTATPNYKIYRALLTQTGTSAPVATVLENTLGDDIVWTRGGAGQYTGTLNGAFTDNKVSLPYYGDNGTVATILSADTGSYIGRYLLYAQHSVSNYINIDCQDASFNSEDLSVILGNGFAILIDFKVYN